MLGSWVLKAVWVSLPFYAAWQQVLKQGAMADKAFLLSLSRASSSSCTSPKQHRADTSCLCLPWTLGHKDSRDQLKEKAKASRSYHACKALFVTHRQPSSSGIATKEIRGCSRHGTGRGRNIQIGPRSASDRQGQACRGLSGRRPTVVDTKVAPTIKEKSKAEGTAGSENA